MLQVFGCLLALIVVVAATGQQPNAPPVNPEATPAARALLRSLDALSGHATMSGQHNFPNTVSRYSDRVFELTERYPAVFGQDFGFSGGEDKDSTLGRPAMIEEVIRQYRAGAVIALTWHAVRPTEEEPVTFHSSVQGHLTAWEFAQVTTPGTELYSRWARQVDLIAGYLRELQDAGVPVLFRPYHEMNGNWFWWGGRPGPKGTQVLYRQIFDRYVHRHHLNNLIWVWNVNSPGGNAGDVQAYYPGDGYADVLTMDIYGPFEQAYYDSMVALAGPTRPIALAEVGAMPSLEVLAKQPRWAYFMMWSGLQESSNSMEQLQTMFHAPGVVNRGDERLAKPLPSPSSAPLPVTPGATPEAQALLARLYRVKGGTALQGLQVIGDAATMPAQTADFAEFTLADEPNTSERMAAFRAAAKAGKVVALRWLPPSPTGGGSEPLTDFEWGQLRTPGTALQARWVAETDAAGALLKTLEKEHIAVLWSGLPACNAQGFWWSGRPGPEGCAELVREQQERLVEQDGVRSVLWNWEPATPGFGGSGNAGWAEFYPGPLYTDVLTLDAATVSGRFNPYRALETFGAGKPVGLRLDKAPAAGEADAAASRTGASWQWIVTP